MPILTLDQTAINIDTARRSFPVLRAEYGEGYEDGVLVGSSAGLHEWQLTASVLVDHASYNDPVNSLPSFQYYWNFFQARQAEGNGVFIIAWRSLNYHACFADNYIEAEVFTSDLFASGVRIRQRRVVGELYESDGSITP